MLRLQRELNTAPPHFTTKLRPWTQVCWGLAKQVCKPATSLGKIVLLLKFIRKIWIQLDIFRMNKNTIAASGLCVPAKNKQTATQNFPNHADRMSRCSVIPPLVMISWVIWSSKPINEPITNVFKFILLCIVSYLQTIDSKLINSFYYSTLTWLEEF